MFKYFKRKRKADLRQKEARPELPESSFFPSIIVPKKSRQTLKSDYETGPTPRHENGIILEQKISENEIRNTIYRGIEIDSDGNLDYASKDSGGFQIYKPGKEPQINDSE